MKKRSFTLLIALVVIFVFTFGTVSSENIQSTSAKTQKVIVINPGHQKVQNSKKEPIAPGSRKRKMKVTGGATGRRTRIRESKINLSIGLKLKAELEKRGYKVIMTRTKQNVNLSNSQRAKIGNKAKADAVISIHCDDASSGSVRGAHTIAPGKTYTKSPLRKKSSRLAKCVIGKYCAKTKIKNRGVNYRNDLTGLNWSKVPAIYIEMGFLSNRNDEKKLTSKNYQKKCAQGMADGLDQYFKKK